MNILDHVEENTDRYEPSLIIIIALGSLVLLGLGLQFEAIYSDFLVNKSRIEEPGLMICFFSPYSKRWIVQLFGVLGIGLSCSILYKRHWKLFESILFNSVLLSPIVIFVLDQIMIIKILN